VFISPHAVLVYIPELKEQSKKKYQTKISQGPLDLGFKFGRSKCSICYDMLDFYKKKKKKKRNVN
jgi:hypothetical protein